MLHLQLRGCFDSNTSLTAGAAADIARACCNLQVLLDCCFNGASLACALCGAPVDVSTDFDVQKVFRVVVDGEEAASSSSSRQGGDDGENGTNRAAAGGGRGGALSSEQLVLQCLWQVLAAWGPQQKRAFIKFVTGSSRCGQTHNL